MHGKSGFLLRYFAPFECFVSELISLRPFQNWLIGASMQAWHLIGSRSPHKQTLGAWSASVKLKRYIKKNGGECLRIGR